MREATMGTFDGIDLSVLLGVAGAALPGVLVALIAQYLTQRRESQRQRRVNANTRMLVALEIDANRSELASFWRTINELDTQHRDEGAEAHLAAMAESGLLGYSLPAWSARQWEHLSSQAVGALSPQEITKTYALYADLRALGDLYTQLLTIPPEEKDEYTHGGSGQRFWYNYFAGRRVGLFERLRQTVQRVLDAGVPLEKSA
jgi:hypothetical protein